MAEVDLDPNFRYRQAMSQNQLQAIQLGAGLVERRQMMEMRRQQMEEQAADALIRRNTMELQNQVQRLQKADMVEETEAQKNEWLDFQNTLQSIDAFRQDPNVNPFPVRKMFKSKAYNNQINQIYNQLENLTPAFQMQKQQEETRKFKQEQFAKKLERARAVEARFPDAKIISETNTGFTVDDAALAHFEPRLMQEQRDLEATKALGVGARGEALKSLRGRVSEELYQALEQSVGTGETIREKNTRGFIQAAKRFADSAGYTLDDAEVDSMSAKMMATGSLGNFPVEANKEFSSRFGVLELVDRFEKKVAEWEKKYPGRKFEDNIGIIPSASRDLKSYVEAENDPAKKELIQILTTFAGIKNQQLRTTSGMTVTPQESSRLADQLGDKFDKNTLLKIRQFRSDSEAALRNELEAYTGYAIPDYYRFFMLTRPKEGEDTVNVIDFVESRRKRRESPKQGQPAQGGASTGATNSPVRVTSQQQYDELPSGAFFIDDTGQTWQKP